MKVTEIKDKKIWEEFLKETSEKSFLDSWNWGEFQKRAGNKIWRFGIFIEDRLVSLALVSKISARRGTFFLIQHGPILIENLKCKISEACFFAGSKIKNCNFELKIDVLNILLEKLKEIAKEEKVDFLRMNPLWEDSEENKNILKDLGFIESLMHANAYEGTWKLDINLPEEELLKNMRKTTRYLIRQTMKNPDISIEKSEKLSDIDIYQNLNKEVAKRQKFVSFSLEYIRNEFDLFSKDGEALWFFGKYKGEIVAGALVVFWSGIGFYHQAASLSKYSKLSIPYLLQWTAIKEAKKRGCELYDFWGYTDPKKNPKHPWAGPTLFKMGFGGFKKEYVKTIDLPFSKKYYLTRAFEKIRKIKRGL